MVSISSFDISNLFLESLILSVHNSLFSLIIDANVAGIESSIIRDTIILDTIEQQNADLTNLITFASTVIFNAIQDITLDDADNSDEIINAIVAAIIASNNSQTQILTVSDDASLRAILDAIAIESTAQINTVQGIIQPILDSNSDIENTLFGINLSLSTGLTNVATEIASLFDIVSAPIGITINNEIVLGAGLLDGLTRDLTEIFRIAIDGQVSVAQGITSALLTIIRDQISKDELLGTLEVNELKRLVDIFLSFQEPQLKQYGINSDNSIGGIGGIFSEGSFKAWNKLAGDNFEDLKDEALHAMYGHVDPDSVGECGINIFDGVWVDNTVPNVIVNVLVWAISVLVQPLNMAQIKTNIKMQDFRRCFPDALVPPGDLAVAMRRNIIDEDRAIEDIERQGYKHDDAVMLLNVANIFPQLELMLSMWFRGIVSEDTLDLVLRSDGYTPPFIDAIKQVAVFLAPVQDLITMAVREVFTPEIAEAQGQFEDFPEEFAKRVGQLGMSRDLALDYWAAHWQLPSIQMGFEMLHRGVIDDAELEVLQRALDVMPGWRDKVKAISFAPFTRVDIRRMNKVGVLNEAEVKRAYMDIGYDDEKSDKLTEFTLELNKEEGIITLNVASDLSRSNIVGFYVEGILDRTVSLGLLVQAGVNVVAAELFLMDADISIERKDRRDSIGIVLDRFKFGGITFNEAQNELASLGLEEKERNLASVELLKAKEQLTKIPSRTDLDNFLSADLIDNQVYLQTMELNGYSAFWAGQYLLLATGGKDDALN